MNENQNPYFKDINDAQGYVDNVREHFRAGHAQYRGRRTEEQQLIAEVTSIEAKHIIDGVMAGILGVMSSGTVTPPVNFDSVEVAGYSWSDFRTQYQRLLVAFGVITNRLHRDGFQVESFSELPTQDENMVAFVLLKDFLEHNALRFGATSSDVKEVKHKTKYTEDGGVERTTVVVDKDRALSQRELEANMVERGYVSYLNGQQATHIAGKMTPEEYRELRREFPEMDKDDFDKFAGVFTNAKEELETKYGS